jgi:hypothetical protein
MGSPILFGSFKPPYWSLNHRVSNNAYYDLWTSSIVTTAPALLLVSLTGTFGVSGALTACRLRLKINRFPNGTKAFLSLPLLFSVSSLI